MFYDYYPFISRRDLVSIYSLIYSPNYWLYNRVYVGRLETSIFERSGTSVNLKRCQ